MTCAALVQQSRRQGVEMARKVFAWRDGKLVEVEHNFKARPRVHLITDTMDKTWHPADGRTYESKSAFRRATKACGCVEYGDAPCPEYKQSEPSGVKADVIEAAKQVGFLD